MKFPHVFRVLLLLALPLSFSAQGSAASFQGKVVEVVDGERITVVSLGQPLKVKLIASATPAKDQPYADVAQQHLKKLVMDRYVIVHYTSLGQDGYLTGLVLLDGVDIGEQMIRDGVAWYDKSEGTNLSAENRESYLNCEQAARKEARGLWQDSAPVAPWEFRRQQAASQNIVSSRHTVQTKSARAGGQALTSDDLFRSMTSSGRLSAGQPSAGDDPGWKTLAPQAGKFSVFVPGDALDFGATIPTPTGGTADINYCVGKRGKNSYLVIWAKGPSDGASDAQVADDTAHGIVFDLDRGVKQQGLGYNFELKRQRSLRLGNYTGWQYSVSAPGVPGTIRIFARRVGQEREIYVIGVLSGAENEPQVQEFLNSFVIGKL